MKLVFVVIFNLFCVLGVSQVNFEWLVNPKYYRAHNFKNNYARIFLKSKGNGFIDLSGELTIPIKFWAVRDFYDKYKFLAPGMHHPKAYSLYDPNYKKVLPDVFSYASTFSEGMAIVSKGNITYGIDAAGQQLFLIAKDQVGDFYYPFWDGMAVFTKGGLGSDLWGTINNRGQVIVSPKYRYLSNFNDGVAAFQSGSYWGVLDKSGQVVLAPKYDWINGFSEGLSVVRQGQQHGYIDASGKKVIPIMYKQAHNFSEGLAAVQNDSGLWGFIDKNNRYMLSPQFAQAFSFHEGLARVENKTGKIGYIDRLGKLVIDYQFEDGRDLSEGMIAVKQGGKWGYIKILNPPEIGKKQEVIIVKPPIAQAKKLKYGKGILVSGTEIQLEVFDFEDDDGDSISLFFNDQPLLENYLLKNIPVKLQLKLKSNQDNKLVLHAHNLGRKPPNTAAIKIMDSQGRVQQIEMISDLTSSDVLYIFKEQQDVSGQINYTVSYFDVEDRFKEAVAQLPKQELVLFKGSRLRKDMKNHFFIYDNALGKSYLCKDEPTGLVAYYGPLNQNLELKLVDKKYNILGYVCRKAIVTKRGKQTEVFYTTELPFAYSPFEGVPGVVLQYSEKTPFGMKTATASKVSFLEMSDELFSIEGYELQSKAEKQKQKLKEMRALIEARKKGVEDAKAKLLNKPAPPIVFNFLDGLTKPLSEYSGKVVVLNFWFVECPPCKIEIPKLNTVVDSFKNKDVVFVSIARNKADVVKAFLMKNKFDYLPSVGDEHFDLYGVKTFPSTVIINKAGDIIYFSSGLKKDIDKELIDVIQGALK